MGGHGGLNILPQKSWHVYNYENREKVRRDEAEVAAAEAAARAKQQAAEGEARRQLLLERARKRKRADEEEETDQQQAQQLTARLTGVRNAEDTTTTTAATVTAVEAATSNAAREEVDNKDEVDEDDAGHINFFRGGFKGSLGISASSQAAAAKRSSTVLHKMDKEFQREHRRITRDLEKEHPEKDCDEKYRLGYGVVGAEAKRPWYMQQTPAGDSREHVGAKRSNKHKLPAPSSVGSSKKKSMEELRAERAKREQAERAKAKRIVDAHVAATTQGKDGYMRGERYHSSFGNRR